MTIPDLNNAQTVVLLIAAGIAFLLLLFPPWLSEDRRPRHGFLLGRVTGGLALQILILELAALLVTAGTLLWALKTHQESVRRLF